MPAVSVTTIRTRRPTLCVEDALPAEEVRVADRLRGGEGDRQVARVLVDLGVPRLAFLLELGERRNDHRHELQDDRRRDVRHDPEREDRESRQRVAGEQVEQAEHRAALVAEVVRDLVRVHARRRDEAPEPVERQDDGGEEEAAPELRHPPCVREPGEHYSASAASAPQRGPRLRAPRPRSSPRRPRSPARKLARLGLLVAALLRLVRRLQPGDAAARGLDLLDRALRERVRGDEELHGEVAVAEDLHVAVQVADQALLLQQLGRDLGAGVEAGEVADVHRPDRRAEGADRHRVLRGRAALLAHAHVRRHLAALEPGAHVVRAGARLLALDPAAGVAALARAEAAADTLAAFCAWAGFRLERFRSPASY